MSRQRVFQSIAALVVTGAGALAGNALGQVPPPPKRLALPPQRPATASCNTGQAPMVTVETRATYVHLSWQSVPNAVEYHIDRATREPSGQGPVVLPQTAANPQDYFRMTQYWDAVPDTRYSYTYSVSAIRSDHCYGTTTVSVANTSISVPNPAAALARRLTADAGELFWSPVFGALFYRVDGPGLSATMRAGAFTEGLVPQQGFYDPALSTASAPPAGCAGCTLVMRIKLSTNGGQYRVTALYPGNFADYRRSTVATLPVVPPCILTGSAPINGYAGQNVTLHGANLQFADQAHFIMDQRGDWYAPVSQDSRGDLHVSTAGFSPLQGNPPFAGKFFVHNPAGWCGGPTFYEVLAGTPAAQPPPPPRPSGVLVPGVVGFGLNDAIQVLRNAGFQPLGGGGPSSANARVWKQNPEGGARAAAHSAVSLFTYAAASGYGQLTLTNNMAEQRSVNVWLFDQTAGIWSQGSSVDYGSATTFSLTSGHVYLVLAVDPQQSGCGGMNDHDNPSCEYWRLPGVPGDAKGPSATVDIR